MVQSLATIAAKRIPYWAKLEDWHIVALENVKMGIKEEYIGYVSQFGVIQDAIRDLKTEIAKTHSLNARDECLHEYRHMAWAAYDTAVEELNIMRNNTSENIKNYPLFSFVTSRIMGCPNWGEEYTDENNLMFRESLTKWEKFKFPDTSEEEDRVAIHIREYFRIISNFVTLYDKLYDDDFRTTMQQQMQLNFFHHQYNVLKTKMDSLREAMSNIETAIICRNVSKDFTFIDLF